MPEVLSQRELVAMDAYWRAANYLSVGQIYLYDNPRLEKPLSKEHVKPRLLGHWGTTPGLNFLHVHLNRLITQYDLNMIYITGPGHGGPGLVANAYLDGEAETGPLATSWHSNKFLNPATDGVVLPILHLNGYKIANPTVLARVSQEELDQLFRGYGYTPYVVEGHEPEKMHQLMAVTLGRVIGDIQRTQAEARQKGFTQRPRWPMIVLRTPKGWTCPTSAIMASRCQAPVPSVASPPGSWGSFSAT
jgi:phosphoketolase